MNENEIMPISVSLNDSFDFECSKNVPCFNECCRDLNQFLTPYDILRLKNNLKIPSDLFLNLYTTKHTGPESGLPVITFKSSYSSELKCPFVSTDGCKVYKDRPSSCRTYPIIRVVTRSRDTGKNTEHFMMIKEPHCLGFDRGKKYTVAQWIKNQEITVYNEMNDMLMEIISFKNHLIPGQLSITSERFFYLACYDLDSFRKYVFEKKMLQDVDISPNILDEARDDDVALLKIGLQSIKQKVFGIK